MEFDCKAVQQDNTDIKPLTQEQNLVFEVGRWYG